MKNIMYIKDVISQKLCLLYMTVKSKAEICSMNKRYYKKFKNTFQNLKINTYIWNNFSVYVHN